MLLVALDFCLDTWIPVLMLQAVGNFIFAILDPRLHPFSRTCTLCAQ